MQRVPKKTSFGSVIALLVLIAAWYLLSPTRSTPSQQTQDQAPAPTAVGQRTTRPTSVPSRRTPTNPARPTSGETTSSGWSDQDRRVLNAAGLDPETLLGGSDGATIERLGLQADDVVFLLDSGKVELRDVYAVARLGGKVVAFLADYRGGSGQELGWLHIVHRHIEWSDRGRAGGSTSMFPTGAVGTPRNMQPEEVQALIIAGIENELAATDLSSNDRTELVYRLPAADRNRWGIDRVQIVLEPWGGVVTAYPLSGAAVIRKQNQ